MRFPDMAPPIGVLVGPRLLERRLRGGKGRPKHKAFFHCCPPFLEPPVVLNTRGCLACVGALTAAVNGMNLLEPPKFIALHHHRLAVHGLHRMAALH